jgi:hypothetical protein
VQRAATFGPAKKDTTPTPGTVEDAIVTFAREHNVPVASLSTAQKNTIRANYAAATREPKDGTPDKAATLAQKAAAERWKQGELEQLETKFRAAKTKTPFLNQMTGEFVVPAPMTDAELDAAKARIQTSYLEQIGASAAAPAAAQPPSATAATPEALLKGQKPGRYTLTDGSVWLVDESGVPKAAPK